MFKHVSYALNLRDGFKGKPIATAANLTFTLDGQSIQPICKEDGWCIFIDLPKGEMEFCMEARQFAPFRRKLDIQDPATFYLEEYVTLEPTREYPFGRVVKQADVTMLHKGKPLVEQMVYIVPDRKEQPLKLAQDGVEAGFTELKLFSAKKPGLLALPGHFLVEDGARSEVVTLAEAGEAGAFMLAAPLVHPHSRGAAFKRVAGYRTDGQGRFFLALADTADFTAYWEGPKGFMRMAATLDHAADGLLKLDLTGGK